MCEHALSINECSLISQEDNVNTRDRILEAAEQVIRNRGFARATTKDIACAAGCSEGSLYNHFRGKEDLFLCILRERLPAFIQQVIRFPERAGQGSVRANLRELTGTALIFYQQAIALGASILSDPALLEQQRQALHQLNAGPHKGNELLAVYLEREQDEGRIRSDADPETAAAAILGACFQRAYIAEFLGVEPSAKDPDAFIEDLLDTVLAGLQPQGRS